MKVFRFLPILILLIAVFWTGSGLFKYNIFYTQDFKHHFVRSIDAIFTIQEWHLPLRWAGILNYECGVPIYNFYNPLLYYLVALLHIFTQSIFTDFKIINFLSLLTGTLFFFWWMREDTKNRWASFGGAMLYLFAPYRFLLTYVRGSPEYLSYAIAPIVFYFFVKALRQNNEFKFYLNLFLASIFGGLMALSHNVVFIFIMPILLIYLLFKMYQFKLSKQRLAALIFSYVSIIGFSAFFLFPAILEAKFTQLNIPIFNYQDHFPTLSQVINSKWEYGDSAIYTTDDHMSFQLGYAQWVVLGIGVVWLIGEMWVSRGIRKNIILPIIFLIFSLTFLYLVLPWSLSLWNKLVILQNIQFSWRFLGICVFTIAVVFTYILALIKNKYIFWCLLFSICALSIIANRNHILPQPIYENDIGFYEKLDKLNYQRRSLSAEATTVLPPSAEKSCYLTTPIISSNEPNDKIEFQEIKRGSTFGQIRINISKSEIKSNILILNLGYFPEIHNFTLNNRVVNYFDCEGKVCFTLNQFQEGENILTWSVGQTAIERLFGLVTLLFLCAWILILIRLRIK